MIINSSLMWRLECFSFTHKYSNTNTYHHSENIAAATFASISTQINMVNIVKLACQTLTEAIKSKAINKAIITHKAYNTITPLQAVCSPAEEFHISVTQCPIICGTGTLNIQIIDLFIYYRVFAVLVIIILAFLSHVIRRVPDHPHDLRVFFALDSFGVLFDEQGELLALGEFE